jgi:outer membrane protein assembly factor BamB
VGLDGSIIVALRRYPSDTRDNLYALDPADGRVRWSARLPAGPGAPPLVDAGGSIYVTDGNPLLSRFDGSGKSTWSAPFGLRTPALGPDGTIYVVQTDELRAFGP